MGDRAVPRRGLMDSARIAVKTLWNAACLHDGVDPGSSFVIFSPDNPYEPLYQQAMLDYLQLERVSQ